MSLTVLLDRAKMLASVRCFFAEKEVIEVDCKALCQGIIVDAHIEPFQVDTLYLHTSPEAGIKKLLAYYSLDLYQLSHVFRKGDYSPLHDQEFMMLEWYRKGFSFENMIEETLSLLELFLGPKPLNKLAYKEAFQQYLNLDPFSVSREDLLTVIQDKHLNPSEAIKKADKDTLLTFLLGFCIEPFFPKDHFTILIDYPANQGALAVSEGEIAKRFEIYHKGIELANGYLELQEAELLEKRFCTENQLRQDLEKSPLSYDQELIDILRTRPLSPYCGVSVGFDRLMMLRHKTCHISMVTLPTLVQSETAYLL